MEVCFSLATLLGGCSGLAWQLNSVGTASFFLILCPLWGVALVPWPMLAHVHVHIPASGRTHPGLRLQEPLVSPQEAAIFL